MVNDIWNCCFRSIFLKFCVIIKEVCDRYHWVKSVLSKTLYSFMHEIAFIYIHIAYIKNVYIVLISTIILLHFVSRNLLSKNKSKIMRLCEFNVMNYSCFIIWKQSTVNDVDVILCCLTPCSRLFPNLPRATPTEIRHSH